MKKAGVAGSICLDINPVFKHYEGNWIEEGKQMDLSDIRITLGGCVGNTGLALSRLGVPVKLYCKTGNDQIGSLVEEIIQGFNIDMRIDRVDESSSASIIISPPKSDRTILHKSGASQSINENDIPNDFFEDLALFHFGYPPKMRELWKEEGKGMKSLLKRVKDLGVATSIDMCMPNQGDGKNALTAFLPYTDIFLPSYEEMLRLLMPDEFERINRIANGRNLLDFIDESTIDKLADWIIERGVHIVLLKLGKKGLYLKTDGNTSNIKALNLPIEWNNRELWIAPKLIENPVSTIGAGDTAIAGFLAAILSQKTPEEALSIASCTAAKCIESKERGLNMPNFKSIESIALSPYKQEELTISINGWKTRGMFFSGPNDRQVLR